MADTLDAAERKIKDTQDAAANGLVAVRVSENLYIVKSYGQTVAIVVRGKGYMVSTQKFTTTTSRHQGMIRRAWMGHYTDVPQETIESILTVATSL